MLATLRCCSIFLQTTCPKVHSGVSLQAAVTHWLQYGHILSTFSGQALYIGVTGNQKVFVNMDLTSSAQETLLTQDYSQMMCGVIVPFPALVYSTFLVSNTLTLTNIPNSVVVVVHTWNPSEELQIVTLFYSILVCRFPGWKEVVHCYF